MATQLLLPKVAVGNGAGLQLITTRQPCNGFIIQADPANTGTVWVGDSTVSASGTTGIRIEIPVAGEVLPYFTVGETSAPNGMNLSDYYVDSATASQHVNVLYVLI